jgi:cytochrome c oxidase subunit II
MQPTAPGIRLRSTLRVGLPLVVIGLLAAGCMLPPEPKTDAGQDVFNLYLIVLGLALIVFIGVEGFILYAVLRYRRQPGDDVLPEQLHGNNTVELIWTAIPTVIVLILFVFSMITLGVVEARSDEQEATTIEVDAFQWQWEFRYDNGVKVSGTPDEPPILAVPVGEPVRLILNSLDVNHAFFVPEFLLKRDVINFGPAREPNELTFTVTEEGTYAGQCAEFCGEFHAEMRLEVQAMPREEFDAYLEALAAGETPPTGSEDCDTTIELAAVESIQFDAEAIEAPAGQDFCIEFTNNDTVRHDVGIVEADFDGDDVEPGETITYLIPAMEAGDYNFICTLHPQQMVGVLTVGE